MAVAVLHFRDDLYASRRPLPGDVTLLIEVADTSLAYDREIKAPLYAHAGITDYWIVNLENRTVEVYRDPLQAEGRYATLGTYSEKDSIEPLSIAGLSITVSEILA